MSWKPWLGMLLAGALTACGEGGWFSDGKVSLPGERISVMTEARSLDADPRLAALVVRLPEPVANDEWTQQGAVASHAMPHADVSGFAQAWRVSIGTGSSRSGRISAAPVVAAGRVYAMDAQSRVSAVDATTGAMIWQVVLRPQGDGDGGVGGGVSFDNGRLFVATGYAEVMALDAAKGDVIWRQGVTAPMRAGPTVGGGRVFAASIDNQVHAFDAESGRRLWSHSGITETAGIYGGASPALDSNIVVAAYSSGELFALRADNGRVLWSEAVAGIQRSDAVSALADIRGLPVVDRGQVYAVSHAGRTVAIDLRSGTRIWDQGFGGLSTPAVAGDFVFLITVEAELVAASRRDGRVRWVQQLERYRDANARRGLIVWSGPLLAGDRLFAVNSNGSAVTAAVADGQILSRFSLPGPVSVAPVAARRSIYILTDDAQLVALR